MTRCSNRLALLLCAAMAMAPAMGGELRGSWQSYWLAHSAAQAGPLAQAHALLPAIAAAPASSGVTLAQVQGSAVWGGLQWHADVVAQALAQQPAALGHLRGARGPGAEGLLQRGLVVQRAGGLDALHGLQHHGGGQWRAVGGGGGGVGHAVRGQRWRLSAGDGRDLDGRGLLRYQ